MTARTDRRGVTRRTVLTATAAAGLGALLPRTAMARVRPAWHSAVLAYLQGLSRPDGGCAWDDQPESHLTPTFAAVGCYRVLGVDPPDKARLAEFVRTHHPFRVKKLERELRVFEYQQIQSLLWLGEDASSF